MNSSLRFPFQERDLAAPSGSQLPYLPLLLNNGSHQVAIDGLLDTGATVNVLPSRAVIILATIASFSPVRLAFAWSQLVDVPVILGQVNFFLEFDVCFFRSQAAFEVTPKQNR